MLHCVIFKYMYLIFISFKVGNTQYILCTVLPYKWQQNDRNVLTSTIFKMIMTESFLNVYKDVLKMLTTNKYAINYMHIPVRHKNKGTKI